MKTFLVILGLLSVAASACAADVTADQLNDPNLAGLQTANGRIVYDFIDLWFNQDKPAEAFDKYVSHTQYVDHAVYSASLNKQQNFEEEKTSEARVTPAGEKFVFEQLIAQGDLVFAHIWARNSHNKIGNELIEIERLKGGKIIDHWDIHAPLKPDSMVFTGLDR